MRRLLIGPATGLGLFLCLNCALADEVATALRAALAGNETAGQIVIADRRLISGREIALMYAKRDYRPMWKRPTALALINALEGAERHGLRSTDYHLAALQEMAPRLDQSSAQLRAYCDILATDALTAYAYHLRFGKVDPEKLYPRWNLAGRGRGGEVFGQIEAAIEQDSIHRWLASLTPGFSVYAGLQEALSRYRTLAAGGGWPVLPAGPALELDVRHPQVALLRTRLRLTGELDDGLAPDRFVFDAVLAAAVRNYQQRNGLAVDGIVGPETRAAMNITAAHRVQQLRVNLERARWVLHDIGDRTVVINLAGYSLYLAVKGRVQWSSRVVIGRTYRKTPVFRSRITYIVLNPPWVVPPTIFREDILPLAIQDPGAVRAKDLRVYTKAGREIEPESVDWQRYLSEPFPYSLQQAPGPNNALGRIKFVFPNPYTVFMHDTPQRELFERADRAFSSGCIRLQDPMELALLLLSGTEQWNRAALKSAVASGRTRNITLPEPVDIVVMYWTAGVGPGGIVHFRKDIYQRDAAVLKALDSGL